MFWILQKDFSRLGVANNNDFSDQSSEGYESECVWQKDFSRLDVSNNNNDFLIRLDYPNGNISVSKHCNGKI